MICIGIDAGKKTGFAIWDSKKKKFEEISTTDFWGVIERIRLLDEEHGIENLKFRVEDPSQNKAIHWNQKDLSRYKSGSRQELNAACKIAQSVGSNKREATLILDFLEKIKANYRGVKPTTRKTDAKRFKNYTGWTGKTNEHNRDAAMLVLGL